MPASHDAIQQAGVTAPGEHFTARFGVGECGLVTIGGVHMHAEVEGVTFKLGKTWYDVVIGDAVGNLHLSVPSERLNIEMATMPGYEA